MMTTRSCNSRQFHVRPIEGYPYEPNFEKLVRAKMKVSAKFRTQDSKMERGKSSSQRNHRRCMTKVVSRYLGAFVSGGNGLSIRFEVKSAAEF